MKLQFAFPNPRGKKKGPKKHIAKRHKKSKTKSVKAKLRKAVHHMAKKRKGSKRRKNPLHAYASKKTAEGKTRRIGHTSTKTKPEMKAAIASDKTLKRFEQQAAKLRKQKRYDEAKAMSDRANRLKKLKLENMLKDRQAFAKDIKAFKADGATVTISKSKEKAVAKKRRKKKKSAAKKATKKASPKKASKKRRTKRKSKRTKTKRTKRTKRHAAKKAHTPKKRRKSGKRRKSSRRRRRMITHTHAASTRHIRKGSKAKISARKRKGSYKVKAHFGRGKKRVKMSGTLRQKKGILSGIFKINPFRSNPVNYKSGRQGIEKFLGHDGTEVATMAAAAAAAPYITKFLTKNVLPYVQNYIPASAVPHVVNSMPLIAGVALNVLADSQVGQKLGSGRAYAQKLGDGLVAVGVISSVYAFASKMAGGVAGINFTPNMGVMPQLNGINFTPNGMGVMPQLNGVVNRGDFGATGDYGGNVGYHQSRADFGADYSQDSQGMVDADGDQYASSMN